MKWGQKSVDSEDHKADLDSDRTSVIDRPVGNVQTSSQMDRIEAKLDKLLQQQTKSRTL